MQNLHLHFIGATSIHPGAPNHNTKAEPPSVRLTYAFCDERDKRITTQAGRYENERYKPSSGERAMLKRLREVDFGDDWTVESMPCVPDASHAEPCPFAMEWSWRTRQLPPRQAGWLEGEL